MKYKLRIVAILGVFIIVGSLSAKADSLNNSYIVEQNNIMQETITDIMVEDADVKNIEESSQIAEQQVEDVDKAVQGVSDINYETGKYYFFQKYLYDCKIAYLEKYIAYLQLQISAYEQVYQLGDTAEAVLQSYKVQKALAEAEITVAKNESAYNNLYLDKNQLEYSDIIMNEIKSIESIDYYMEKYPEVDYMKFACYVTDYNNAIAGIDAKKVEVAALETEVAMTALLLESGEISQLEYEEKEVALAKSQFELEQQNVALNVAYWQLMMLCK